MALIPSIMVAGCGSVKPFAWLDNGLSSGRNGVRSGGSAASHHRGVFEPGRPIVYRWGIDKVDSE